MTGRRLLAGVMGCLLLAACVPARDVIGSANAPTPLAGAPPGRLSPDRAQYDLSPGTPPARPIGSTGPGSTAAASGAAPVPWAVDPATSGRPWPGATVEGLLTFRGGPTRSFYGRGPVPTAPVVRWRYPAEGGLCRESREGGETSVWCGTGWTGQPAIWEPTWPGAPAATLVAFGAYDGAIHVLDADTGRAVARPLVTGDIIKGSVTVDPDGYPLLYVGSRDNRLRVVALDRGELVELWSFDADDVPGPTMWNDDWDGSPMVVGDLLVEGGENSRLHVFRLHRRYDDAGRATVRPELVWHTAGWDDELLAALAGGPGPENVSIESSVAISGTIAYVANSGGLVQGWDLAPLEHGRLPVRTFRFWMGDDTDATLVVDHDGFLYAAAEYERDNDRAAAVGQLVKLDPRRPTDPVVWSLPLRTGGVPSGVWATPALWRDVVVVATNAGELLAVDRARGTIRWQKQLAGPTWSSPVVVDDVLVQGDCAGVLRAWDGRDPAVEPTLRWSLQLPTGCIESTPALWKGRLVVGTRSGAVYGIGDRG